MCVGVMCMGCVWGLCGGGGGVVCEGVCGGVWGDGGDFNYGPIGHS